MDMFVSRPRVAGAETNLGWRWQCHAGNGELGVLDLPYLTLYSTVAVIKVKVDRLLRNELKMKGKYSVQCKV